MKIRAITLGIPNSFLGNNIDKLENHLEIVQEIKKKLIKNGVEVQTIRLCTQPFEKKTPIEFIQNFEEISRNLDTIDEFNSRGLVDYYSFLPGLCDHIEPLNELEQNILTKIPNLLKKHENMFTSIQVSSKTNGINFEAISKCANMIKEIGKEDPFTNLKFAVTFNVPPNTPFFPSAYHIGSNPKISIALEAADEVVKIVQKYSSEKNNLIKIREQIQERFCAIYDQILDIVKPICKKNGLIFEGIDFSPSQYPEKEKSIGTAIESLGLGHFGELGTVFAIGFLTSTLQSIDRPKIGFSGFMQPLLEDYIIGKRHDEGKININQLLLNSTVCGLGLDCIPLPGNVDENTLTLLMLDTAMISCRLNKPLTARLMPIPGKTEHDRTAFEFEYFINSKICEIRNSSLNNLKEFLKQNSGILF
ncbi:MAG: DUF711 family protein [archaeon]|nr:DUF711 family protein [archaeon]